MSPCWILEGLNGKMCELLHTSAAVQKMQGALSFIANRSSFFLIGELLLGNLSETVVVHGYAAHNCPCGLVGHLVGNRASFLCTKAPMRRIPNEVSGHQLTSTSVPLAEEGPGHCWPGQVGRAGW